jgi:hypothetical protein
MGLSTTTVARLIKSSAVGGRALIGLPNDSLLEGGSGSSPTAGMTRSEETCQTQLRRGSTVA